MNAVWRFEAIGVPWSISTPEPLAADVVEAVRARIDSYDRTWSRFRSDSLVARIGSVGGTHALPHEAGPLLELYRVLYEATDGRMSPLVARSLERLGYDAALTMVPGTPTPAPAWEDAIAWVGTALAAPQPVRLDVGAAGKGQLVDLVAEVLAHHGVGEATVDASGDLLHIGDAPIRVALEHPADARLAIGVATIGGSGGGEVRALCASATNRRRWGDGLHHVLDATTGLPVDEIVATWVSAPSAMVADGVATALFLTSPDRIPIGLGARWARMSAAGLVEVSDGFPAEIFRKVAQ